MTKKGLLDLGFTLDGISRKEKTETYSKSLGSNTVVALVKKVLHDDKTVRLITMILSNEDNVQGRVVFCGLVKRKSEMTRLLGQIAYAQLIA